MNDKSYASVSDATFINEKAILDTLGSAPKNPSSLQVGEILGKAALLKGLEPAEVAVLMNVTDPDQTRQLFDAAIAVKRTVYGDRVVLFAPLYISNLCKNECDYCAFRAGNTGIARKELSQEEIHREIEAVLATGQKRILMVAGESHTEKNDFDYLLKAVGSIYAARHGSSSIRRVNVNLAPLSVEGYRKLLDAKVGTVQIFQETYHPETYLARHLAGPKRDYCNRMNAFDRAMEAGGENGMDVGLGALLGLYDWRFEVLGLLRHSNHLLNAFGVGPHTISVPRVEPATGSQFANSPLRHAVPDDDFRKLVAVLRLAVPYTGIIMSTRENEAMRRATLALGVSQLSAGSRTDPGGYTGSDEARKDGQFFTGDHRGLGEVMLGLVRGGYIPSFCVGCEENGRMGRAFMKLARAAQIGGYCEPNALLSFQEFLTHYAKVESPLRVEGTRLVQRKLALMQTKRAPFHDNAPGLLRRVEAGELGVSV
jgi:2-iminoacetate synthase